MQHEGFFPTEVSYACSLKACAITEDIDRGFELHAQIVNDCQLEEHIIIANALVDMYSKCHRLLEAQEVFDELQNRDVVTWNAIIAGYTQHEHGREALNCFEHMQIAGFSPDANTLPSILKACTSIGALDEGMEIHSQFVKEHLLVKEPHIGTALVDMYAKCGDLQKAQEVFDKLPIRDAVLWNALISGYSQHNCGDEAIKCFHLMLTDGFSPCASTFACMLAVCGGIKALGKGQEFHAFIVTDSCVENNVYVGTALVDMYAKCGALEEAQAVFDELGTLNVASWNALIGGYVQSGFGDEAFMLFESMYRERFSPDTITFAHMLKACGNIGALQRGQSVHTQIVSHGLSLSCEVVGNALLDMYANCGMFAEAWMMFNKLPVQDVVSWSALMVGLSQLGKDEIVFDLFYKMIATGLQPDSVMFSVVLNACSHNGLLEKGEAIFKMITKVHGKIPDVEHYTCMLDLFGRIGHLEMVMAIIKEMPFPVTATVWHIFLGACRLCGHFKLGKWAFEFAVLDDEDVDAAYVSMGDLYTVSE
ncbi:hypothetical protein KP509_12G029700 [Ceratopteris richardii]|nr:hypothetical protein KP509_12G029700 [Ceratopteris richardii]